MSKPQNPIKKIDFAFITVVREANPNGDPLDANRPRTDRQGLGEMSDVCLKRKLRNRLVLAGQKILVQANDRAEDDLTSVRARLEAAIPTPDKLPQRELVERACATFYDARAFGALLAFKPQKKKNKGDGEEDTEAVSVGIRGPVTVRQTKSIKPVDVAVSQISKSTNAETQEKDGARASDTMGTRYRVTDAVYVTYGSISALLAEKTGFTPDDAEALKQAILTLYEGDESAARPAGSMLLTQLVWWEHEAKHGNCNSGLVHDTLPIPNDQGLIVEAAIRPMAGVQAKVFYAPGVAPLVTPSLDI